MADREARAAGTGDGERKIGRTESPQFAFRPMRIPIADRVQGPSGLTHKVLCIVAPAGYGKTVLMSLLLADLRQAGRQCLWLTLDERDATLDNLVGELKSQLRGGSSALNPSHALFGGEEPVERRIDALLDLVNRYPLPLTIFVDNLHHCTDPALGRLLDRLCFETRPTVHLVLSGTRAIPLNVSRGVLEGVLLQIGPAELCFRADDVAGLFGEALSSRLGDAVIAQFVRQTEGWPAAARMAQIILVDTEEPAAALVRVAGSDEGLAHFFERQVLSSFPSRTREFLLAVGRLRTFCAELCQHASGEPDAQVYLDELVRRNVFIIPLDRNGRWYRLHSLFREFLLREGDRSLDANRRRLILLSAGHWCEQHDYWRDAVDYILASGSAAEAGALLERLAALVVRDRGDIRQFIQWMEALHRMGGEAGPEAEYWFAWALVFHQRYDDARKRTRILARRLGDAPAMPTSGEDLRRRIAILQASVDVLIDHLDEAYAGAKPWLLGVTQQDDPFNVTAARCIVSAHHATAFRFVEARQACQSAREAAYQAHSLYAEGWAAAFGGLPPIFEGSYAEGYQELVATLHAVRQGLGSSGGIGGTLALMAAKCATEMGLDDEADQLIDDGIRSARTHGFLDATACGLEAATQRWSGSGRGPYDPAALRVIATAYPPRLSEMLSCFLIRRLIELRRAEEARDEAARIGLEARVRAHASASAGSLMRDLLVDTCLDLWTAIGRTKRAEKALATEIPRARREGRTARSVELALRRAQFAASGGGSSLVLRELSQAIRLAAPRRIVRPFLRHATTICSALAETRPGEWALAPGEEQRFFADVCRRLPPIGTGARPERFCAPEKPLQLTEALTRRELELLRLLESGLSNQQIAHQAGVSVSTIKWHFQNLYQKLNVSRRAAALAAARSLNLLPR